VPPTGVHFNGSVNLPDADTVMRELAARVGDLAHAYPDGETGDRGNWVYFQLPRLQATKGIVDAGTREVAGDDFPQLRLAPDARPEDVDFSIGYADAYAASYQTFRQLRDQGIIPAVMRFQVQYPTPLAVVRVWFDPRDHERVLPAYERALFADLAGLLAAIPHGDVQVQWDVAVEMGIAERGGIGLVAPQLARCVDQVPADITAGLHLCYGDYKHQHAAEPESLRTQVELANATRQRAGRSIDVIAFTVPQYQDSEGYFASLTEFEAHPSKVYFGIVPYYPDRQAPGTTTRQVRLIDRYIADWGVCCECGMGRVEPSDVPRLLDLHRAIVAEHSAS
jgi:hypothetical protein